MSIDTSVHPENSERGPAGTLTSYKIDTTGLLIFRRKKKQNFAGFSGANSRKNRPISRDFRGKKVKIRGKIGRFHGKFQGETSPRNNQ